MSLGRLCLAAKSCCRCRAWHGAIEQVRKIVEGLDSRCANFEDIFASVRRISADLATLNDCVLSHVGLQQGARWQICAHYAWRVIERSGESRSVGSEEMTLRIFLEWIAGAHTVQRVAYWRDGEENAPRQLKAAGTDFAHIIGTAK